MEKAEISEIYSSNQGEGKYIGQRHIFLRFIGCNLSCSYCDTHFQNLKDSGRYEKTSGERNFIDFKNPISLQKVLNIIEGLNKIPHHAVSITGGEPLLWVNFLKKLLPALKVKKYKILLETNGTLYKNLKEIIDCIDIISMDIKLPSSNNGKKLWNLHYNFLKTIGGKEVYIKIVLDKYTKTSDIKGAIRILKKAKINRDASIFLQPATNMKNKTFFYKQDKIFKWQKLFLNSGYRARVIPQIHHLLGEI